MTDSTPSPPLSYIDDYSYPDGSWVLGASPKFLEKVGISVSDLNQLWILSLTLQNDKTRSKSANSSGDTSSSLAKRFTDLLGGEVTYRTLQFRGPHGAGQEHTDNSSHEERSYRFLIRCSKSVTYTSFRRNICSCETDGEGRCLQHCLRVVRCKPGISVIATLQEHQDVTHHAPYGSGGKGSENFTFVLQIQWSEEDFPAIRRKLWDLGMRPLIASAGNGKHRIPSKVFTGPKKITVLPTYYSPFYAAASLNTRNRNKAISDLSESWKIDLKSPKAKDKLIYLKPSKYVPVHNPLYPAQAVVDLSNTVPQRRKTLKEIFVWSRPKAE